MAACVLGTSNSIMRGGWYDGFKTTYPGEVTRYALGGAPFIQLARFLNDIREKDYEHIILDASPNDEAYWSSIGNIRIFETLFSKFVEALPNSAKIILLQLPTLQFLERGNPARSIERKIISAYGGYFLPVGDILKTIVKDHKFYSQLFSDNFHLNTKISFAVGQALGKIVPLLASSQHAYALPKNTFNFDIEYCSTNRNETSILSTSIINSTSVVLRSGDHFALSDKKICLGAYVHCDITNGFLCLHLPQGHKYVATFIDQPQFKRTMLFIPFKNAPIVSGLSVVGPEEIFDSANNSTQNFIPPYAIALESVLICDNFPDDDIISLNYGAMRYSNISKIFLDESGYTIWTAIVNLIPNVQVQKSSPRIGFSESSFLPVINGLDLQIDVQKSDFGPIFGCSADWVSDRGRGGTLKFSPNQVIARITAPYIDDNPENITLRDPKFCELDDNFMASVHYFTPDEATDIYVQSMVIKPDNNTLYYLDKFIVRLKSSGIWDSILCLWWLSAQNEQASLINVKTPSRHALIPNGAVTFEPLKGWTSHGNEMHVSGYLDTGYVIDTQNQNSIAMFIWSLDLPAGSGEMGGDNYYINPKGPAGSGYRARSSSMVTDSIADSGTVPGDFGWSRTSSEAFSMYKNGAGITDVPRESTPPSSATIWICGWQNTTAGNLINCQYGARRNAFAAITRGLEAHQVRQFYDLRLEFLRAVGVLPPE